MNEQDATNRRIVNRRYWRRHKHAMPDRAEYFKDYYRINREKKLAAAKERREG